jgi:hypothetical protein
MMKVSSEVFRLQILVKGRAVQEYRGPGCNNFIEGRQGSNFELELANLTSRRILAHPTVDGLSAMTGKVASKNDSTHGYILSAFQTMRVPGWRLTDQEVARFVFAGAGGSYAEKTGHGADKGVVACTVWEEKDYVVYFNTPGAVRPDSYKPGQSPMFYDYRPPTFGRVGGIRSASCYHSRCSGQSMLGNNNVECCSAEQQPTSGEENCTGSVQNLGTGFGKKASHHVITTSFNAQEQPTCVAVIYYDDLQGLKNRGIRILDKKDSKQQDLPNPFPKDKGCVPPDGWRG